jgi:hypothetical protein
VLKLTRNGDYVFNTLTDLALVDGIDCSSAPPTLARPIFEHWTVHSVPIVLNVYSNLDFVKNMYREFAGDGPLVWAAHLFARTYVTNLQYPTSLYRDAHLETQRELSTYLGKTLSLVSEALKTPEGPLRDDILATVWILTNYEVNKQSSPCREQGVSCQMLTGSSCSLDPCLAPRPSAHGIYMPEVCTASSKQGAPHGYIQAMAAWLFGQPLAWWYVSPIR